MKKGMLMNVFDQDYFLKILGPRVAEDWKRIPPVISDSIVEIPAEQKEENARFLTKHTSMLRSQLQNVPRPAAAIAGLPFGVKKKWKKETDRMILNLLQTEPVIGISRCMPAEHLDAFQSEIRHILRKIRSFAPDMTVDDMGQALRNYLVYAVFKELNGLPQQCSDAIFGYSMLYPFTDNYLDDPTHSCEEKERYNRLIHDRLRGQQTVCLSEYDEKTCALLDAVLSGYQGDAGQDIQTGLLLMLQAQKESQLQEFRQGNCLSAEEVLRISIFKGGLSVLIDRWFINKEPDETDLLFYYSYGFLLQLCDDLQDITSDRAAGRQTLFTLCTTVDESDALLYRLMNYSISLFSYCQCSAALIPFRDFLQRNCIQLIVTSALGSAQHFGNECITALKRLLPVPFAYWEETRQGTGNPLSEIEMRNYSYMLDIFLEE